MQRSVVVAAVVATVTVTAVVPARAQAVTRCGAVVTADTTLTHDLGRCPGDGLVIGAAGVVLDLGGHTVSGAGSGVGVRVDGRAGVTVTNGSVRGFGVGVAVVAADDARVTRTTVTGSVNAGIAVTASARVEVTGNAARHNHTGVTLAGGTRGTVVTGNLLSDDQQAGVEITFADGNRVQGNVVSRSANGVALEGADANRVLGNRIGPLLPPDGIGVQVYGSRDVVQGNVVTGSVRYAVQVDDFGEDGHTPVTGNVVRGNTVRDGTVGIAVGPEGGGTVLDTVVSGNVVRSFDDDGIAVRGASSGLETTTVAANTSTDNGNLGIDAVPGVRDGGGNVALRNGDPAQCLNITCTPSH